jgi:hypothetical protein
MRDFLDKFIETAIGMGKIAVIFVTILAAYASLVALVLMFVVLLPQSLWFLLLLIPALIILVLEGMLIKSLFDVFD